MYNLKQYILNNYHRLTIINGESLFLSNQVVVTQAKSINNEVYVKGNVLDEVLYYPSIVFKQDGTLNLSCSCETINTKPCIHVIALLYAFDLDISEHKTYNSNLLSTIGLFLQHHETPNQLLHNDSGLKMQFNIDAFYLNNLETTIDLIIILKTNYLKIALEYQEELIIIEDLKAFLMLVQTNGLFTYKDLVIPLKISKIKAQDYLLLEYLVINNTLPSYSKFILNQHIINLLATLEDLNIVIDEKQYQLKLIKRPLLKIRHSKSGYYFELNNYNRLISFPLYNIIINEDKLFLLSKNHYYQALNYLLEDLSIKYENKMRVIEIYQTLFKQNLIEDFDFKQPSLTYQLNIGSNEDVLTVKINVINNNKQIPLLKQYELYYETYTLHQSLISFGFKTKQEYYYLKDNQLIISFLETVLPSLNNNFIIEYDLSYHNIFQDINEVANVKVGFIDDLITMELQLKGIALDELNDIYHSIESNTKTYITKAKRLINLDNQVTINNLKIFKKLNHNNTQILNLPRYYTLYLNSMNHLNYDDTYSNYLNQVNQVRLQEVTLPRISGVLRTYQEVGYQFLMSNYLLGFGSILADEMGLGKTIQVIAFLTKIYEENKLKPSLVIVPKSLILNWMDEFNKFSPSLKVN
ncbi:MAG: SNF2-related protein, partial [Bacilli bacterium]